MTTTCATLAAPAAAAAARFSIATFHQDMSWASFCLAHLHGLPPVGRPKVLAPALKPFQM